MIAVEHKKMLNTMLAVYVKSNSWASSIAQNVLTSLNFQAGYIEGAISANQLMVHFVVNGIRCYGEIRSPVDVSLARMAKAPSSPKSR